jgi:hypothetical protein
MGVGKRLCLLEIWKHKSKVEYDDVAIPTQSVLICVWGKLGSIRIGRTSRKIGRKKDLCFFYDKNISEIKALI